MTKEVKREYEGKGFASMMLYSDVKPFEIIEVRTENKIMIRRMDAEIDPAWKPIWEAGGFAGHCVNNIDQKWIYSSNETYLIIPIRKRKDGKWYDKNGSRYQLFNSPYKFHDFNF